MPFKNFLLQRKHELGTHGRFAKFALQDKNYPFNESFINQLKYLEEHDAPTTALEALADTCKEYSK